MDTDGLPNLKAPKLVVLIWVWSLISILLDGSIDKIDEQNLNLRGPWSLSDNLCNTADFKVLQQYLMSYPLNINLGRSEINIVLKSHVEVTYISSTHVCYHV